MEPKNYETIKMGIKERLEVFREKAREEMLRAGRDPDELTLVAVSKFFPAEYARAAVELGLFDLGENRVGEMLAKRRDLEELGLSPRWHLIGTLQTNKVKKIIGKTELIHSVDTVRLLDEISSRSAACDTVTPILLQVNISDEESKHGFSKNEVLRAAERAGQSPGISLCGLMTMAPIVACDYTPRIVFEELRELFDRMKSEVRDPDLWKILSMGMSQDYVDAIRCGATHIRIGTAIFGPRIT